MFGGASGRAFERGCVGFLQVLRFPAPSLILKQQLMEDESMHELYYSTVYLDHLGCVVLHKFSKHRGDNKYINGVFFPFFLGKNYFLIFLYTFAEYQI